MVALEPHIFSVNTCKVDQYCIHLHARIADNRITLTARTIHIEPKADGTIGVSIHSGLSARAISATRFQNWIGVLALLTRCEAEWIGLTWRVYIHSGR